MPLLSGSEISLDDIARKLVLRNSFLRHAESTDVNEVVERAWALYGVQEIIQPLFLGNKIITVSLMGSYVYPWNQGKGNDIDLLFVIKKQENILESCNKLSTLINKEINPVIMKEMEFEIALKEKEPTISSILEPSQRLLVIGKEYFLKKVMEVYKLK